MVEMGAGLGKPYVERYISDPFVWDAYWGLANLIDDVKKGRDTDSSTQESLCLGCRYLASFAAPLAIGGAVSRKGHSILLGKIMEAELLCSSSFKESIGMSFEYLLSPEVRKGIEENEEFENLCREGRSGTNETLWQRAWDNIKSVFLGRREELGRVM